MEAENPNLVYYFSGGDGRIPKTDSSGNIIYIHDAHLIPKKYAVVLQKLVKVALRSAERIVRRQRGKDYEKALGPILLVATPFYLAHRTIGNRIFPKYPLVTLERKGEGFNPGDYLTQSQMQKLISESRVRKVHVKA